MIVNCLVSEPCEHPATQLLLKPGPLDVTLEQAAQLHVSGLARLDAGQVSDLARRGLLPAGEPSTVPAAAPLED